MLQLPVHGIQVRFFFARREAEVLLELGDPFRLVRGSRLRRLPGFLHREADVFGGETIEGGTAFAFIFQQFEADIIRKYRAHHADFSELVIDLGQRAAAHPGFAFIRANCLDFS